MKNLIMAMFTAILLFTVRNECFSQQYTGVIINAGGAMNAGSYLNIRINDGSKRIIQPTYILDTKVKEIEKLDIYEIYEIAGSNPLIIEGRSTGGNEIVLTERIQNIKRPVILII